MERETWLITGGAGYIGSHIVDQFIQGGLSVIVLDSLYNGVESRIDALRNKHQVEIPLLRLDIREFSKIEKAIKDYKLKGIVHSAALKSVAESFEKEEEYYEVNHIATRNLLDIAQKLSIRNFILSSTAAVYGSDNTTGFCHENDATNPVSVYGLSKLRAESEIKKFNQDSQNFGTSLRFFNVVGAESPALRDNSSNNLVPIILKNLADGMPIEIFGTMHDTHDGTCVRDYVDVRDIARAHFLVSIADKSIARTLNIGTGLGASVKEMISLILKIKHIENHELCIVKARPGDPSFLCANAELAKKELNFVTQYSLEESLFSVID